MDFALKSDTIPPVQSRRPQNEFVYQSENIKKLKDISNLRQRTYEEFNYLNKSVDWFRLKKKEKSISLNLSERLTKRKTDEIKNNELNDIYDSFSDKSYPEQKIVLNIVQEQNAKSLKARGEAVVQDLDQNKTFKIPENLDIRLTESLRIVSDWILLRDAADLSIKPSATEI